MSEVASGVNAKEVGAVIARLNQLLKYGGTSAQVTAPGVAIILSGMKKESSDPSTIDFLTQELHSRTHPQVNLVGIIAHFQAIYDHL